MSYTVTTDIFCDLCNDWTSGVSKTKVDIKNARAIAKDRGWIRKNNKDICPVCSGKARSRHTIHQDEWDMKTTSEAE